MRWYEQYDEDYQCPINASVRRRVEPKEQRRARNLSDDELRVVWRAAEAGGVFGAFIQLSLLTAQRREKVAAMRWSEMDNPEDPTTWTIPSDDREKGNGGVLVLPDLARKVLKRLIRIKGNDCVFPGRRVEGHIVGYSKFKASFDAQVMELRRKDAVAAGEDPSELAEWKGWTIHDLRRTARTLLSRAGVLTEVSERVLGHAQAVLVDTYDQHDFVPEKADALAKLAAKIESIVWPPPPNVTALDQHRDAA
jgi:integrase